MSFSGQPHSSLLAEIVLIVLIQNALLTWCVVRKCNISLDISKAIASSDNSFNISDKEHVGEKILY